MVSLNTPRPQIPLILAHGLKVKEIGGRQWLGQFRSWVLSGVLNVLINAGAMADVR